MGSPLDSHTPPLWTNNIWLPAVLSMFPDILRKTYCVPPLHFNKIPYQKQTVAKQTALVLQPPADKDLSKSEPTGSVGDMAAASLSHVEVHCLPMKSNHPYNPKNLSSRKHNQHHEKKTQLELPLWSSHNVPSNWAPKSVYSSDFRDDFAQQHVLHNLQELSHDMGEVMFILSQLQFSDYLNQKSFAAVTAQYPKFRELGKQYCNGEFDILLIHRHYGILIAELKSVGLTQADYIKTGAQADADVAKRLRRAAQQLDKSERAINYVISDIVCGLQLTVRKTVFLPYVSCAQLERILASDPELEEKLCRSLGTLDSTGCPDRREAVAMCLCSDQVSDPRNYWEVTPAVLSQLRGWWQRRMSATNTQLDNTLYLEIVSRFVGPASSKHVHCVFAPAREVKTDWQAISELGGRLARLVLTLQQIKLLNLAPPKLCLSGPPGTGKSILLVLIGLQWLHQGHDVHVVSVFYKSLAASRLVTHQLKMTLDANRPQLCSTGNIYFYQYNFWDRATDVRRAIRELTEAAMVRRELHVLMDEAWFGYQGLGKCYEDLFTALDTQIPSLHLWAADVGHINIPPQLPVEPMTVPLRYCSSVLREVEEGINLYYTVLDYTSNKLPVPSEGPQVLKLRHEGLGHSGRWPVQCYQCGRDVADLFSRLNIGRGVAGKRPQNNPRPLEYRDVFVLTRSSELQDDVIDPYGRKMSFACQFIQGLRDAGVPVCVLNGTLDNVAQWERDLADVALGETDWVAAAHLGATNGLERKVVVWLPGRMETGDQQYSDEAIEALDRLASVSRCSTQLIEVEMPSQPRTKPSRSDRRSQCPVS